MPKQFTRRAFLTVSTTVALAACSAGATAPSPTQPGQATAAPQAAPQATQAAPQAAAAPTSAAPAAAAAQTTPAAAAAPNGSATTTAPMPAKFQEAPMLAQQVQAGKLPPLAQRLPQEPLVLQPIDEVGQYTAKFAWATVMDTLNDLQMLNACENFLKWTRDTTGFRPNLLTSYEWNADATEVTMRMRKGVKWSDGQPLTFDDYIFWWQDMVLDPTVKYAPPAGYYPGGKPMDLQKIDDYTAKATFAAPNPLFLQYLARGTGNLSSYIQTVPAHYMKQFHPKYTPGADVQKLLQVFQNHFSTIGRPQFTPWILTDHKVGQQAILQRNPYYWKVDPEGKQLPYFDANQITVVQQPSSLQPLAIGGELDYQFRGFSDPSTYSILLGSQQQGNYTVDWWDCGDAAQAGIIINFAYPDKSIADLLWNQKFRQALSYAVDRERIRSTVFYGTGEVRQFAMPPSGPEYKGSRGQQILQQWSKNWTERDPAQAAKLLDEVGVKLASGAQWRTKPDGSPLELVVDVGVTDATGTKSMQLVQEDWQKVGLKTTLNVIDGTLVSQRALDGSAMLRERGGAASGILIAPGHWTPVENQEYVAIGPKYGLYYESNGQQGIKPPAGSFIEKLQTSFRAALSEADETKRNNLILDAYQVHVDSGPLLLGFVGLVKIPVIRKNTMRNVMKTGNLCSWHYSQPNASDPEQWYTKA